MLTQKQILLAGAALGFLGVALGAFGAHALKPTLTANGRLDTYELAVRYHFYHAIALLIIGFYCRESNSPLFFYSATSLLTGVILFSGSLYILALTGFTKIAFVTPVGGLFMLGGWGLLFWGFLKTLR